MGSSIPNGGALFAHLRSLLEYGFFWRFLPGILLARGGFAKPIRSASPALPLVWGGKFLFLFIRSGLLLFVKEKGLLF